MLASLIIAGLLANGSDAPVRVEGLSSEYCPHEDVIALRLTNATDVPVIASLSVERLDDGGRWREYSADVLGTEPFPRKVRTVRLGKAGASMIEWRPAVSSNEGGLREGRYRVVVNVLVNGRPPGRRSSVAQFVVRAAPSCTPPKDREAPQHPRSGGAGRIRPRE
jgi:hypothetical protein